MGVFLASDLEFYLSFEEASGNGTDLSDNGLTAVATNVPFARGQVGMINNSIRINSGGGQAHWDVANNSAFLFGDESFTISFWQLRFNEGGGSGGYIGVFTGADPTAERSWQVFFSQGTAVSRFLVSPDGTQANTVTCENPLTLVRDQWYHHVAIHDADNDQLKHWVTPNGSSLGSPAVVAHSGGCYAGNTQPMLIGKFPNTGPGYHHGNFDEMGLWRRALNDDEVQALYDKTPFSSFESGDTGASADSPSYRYYHGRI